MTCFIVFRLIYSSRKATPSSPRPLKYCGFVPMAAPDHGHLQSREIMPIRTMDGGSGSGTMSGVASRADS